MRTLVILRGAPAAGKSTWIKNMGLEGYTLCADNIRLLIQSPIMTADSTHFQISQQNDKRVWSLLFELLEERMAKGEFVVIDATHCKSTDFSRYNKLCERYRYRRYWVDFSDVPIDVCKERNSNRDAYKRVPENVIDKMYARMETQGNTSGWVKVDRDNFWDSIAIKPLDYNIYKNVAIFGDIHGCYQPLKEYFDVRPFNDDTMYIFTGDYIDRGIQNKEVLEFLLSIMDKRNVLFLEGNHERWLYHYSHDEIEEIKSREFKNNTIPQIYDINTKEIRQFYRKLGQMAYFTFDDKTYFVSHGGISYMPDNLQLVATEQFLKGVGSYKTNIDEIWSENENEIIQIHGHRNVFDVDITNRSYNLEDKVEFGGNLDILTLYKGESNEFVVVQNLIYRQTEEAETITQEKINDIIPLIDQLRAEKYIKEKELGNNISSFNFTHKAFYNKHWNDLICKARGLFIDTTTNKVVARGYEKFFNINEVNATDITHLVHKFGDNKITCYKKENGFLGIMSWVNGELFMATKSSNKGDHVEYFKQIYEQSNINKMELETFLKDNNVSLLFEVIDIENDPHIIKYDKSDIILLDIVENNYEFKRWEYNATKSVANLLNCKCKTIECEFNNSKEFYEWYLAKSDEDNMGDIDIEGVVIECNGFMTKLKFPYYRFWKMMRGVKDKVAKGSNIRLASLYNAESNYFFAWLKTLSREIVQESDIIALREMFYKKNDK